MAHTNPLLTPSQVAERLGVTHHQALSWIAKGLLPIAGQSEDGVPLIRDHIVEINGEALISGVPENLRSPRLRRLVADNDQPRVLPCGCTYATATGPGASEPFFMCGDARSLEAAVRLTEALAAVARYNSFFARLAAVSREAFERHLGSRP